MNQSIRSVKSLLDIHPLGRIRRNHALEHATLQVLGEKRAGRALAGYSDTQGFWVVGEISAEELLDAANRAAARLRAGESGLAIHPFCGTNFAVSGLLAGFVAWLTLLRPAKGLGRKLDQLSLVVSLVTVTLMVSQPLGPRVQAAVTVQPQIGDLQVSEITRYPRPNVTLHRVRTIH